MMVTMSMMMMTVMILSACLFAAKSIHYAAIVKMEIRDSSQISTTAPIFLLSNYFSALNGTIASASFDLMMMVVVVMMVVAVMMLVVAETDGKHFE